SAPPPDPPFLPHQQTPGLSGRFNALKPAFRRQQPCRHAISPPGTHETGPEREPDHLSDPQFGPDTATGPAITGAESASERSGLSSERSVGEEHAPDDQDDRRSDQHLGTPLRRAVLHPAHLVLAVEELLGRPRPASPAAAL